MSALTCFQLTAPNVMWGYDSIMVVYLVTAPNISQRGVLS